MKSMTLSILIATVLSADQHSYEVTPMIGYTFPNGGQQIRDHTTFIGEIQFNNLLKSAIKPELSLMYGDVDRNDEEPGDVDIFRTAINGVYEFSAFDALTPFIKAGIGYETMSDHIYGNQNGVFLDGGLGVKIAISQKVAFKLEAVEMQKYNHSNWENNLVCMAGVSFAFTPKE